MNTDYIRCSDEEYLARDLIPDTMFVIQNNFIGITSPSTIYVQRKRPVIYDGRHLLQKYQQILRLAREKNCHIIYRAHIKRTLKEHMKEYAVLSKRRDQLFDRFLEQGRLVEQRGLRYGTQEDRELQKLFQIDQEIFGIRPENAAIREVEDAAYSLRKNEEALAASKKDENECLYLYF